jgi:hypothetical protein
MADLNTTSNDTSLAALSEFDYFRPHVLQASIENEYDESILCSNLTAQGSTLDFEIPGVSNVYRDLSNSYLELKCKVMKGTGDAATALAADDAVAPVNNMMHSMFSDCEITVCGTRVTDKESHYPYRAVIETVLSAPREILETRSKLAGWEHDKDAKSIDRLLLATTNNVAPNEQFLSRRKQIAESRTLTLIGRLHADMFHQDLDLPPNCRITIKLTRSKNEFVLMAAENSNFTVHITSAILYVRSKEVNSELIEAHREILKEHNFGIPFTQVNLKTYQIPSNMTSATFPSVFNDKMPKRIVIALVQQDRVTGKYTLNPFKFQHFNLQTLTVTVNGKSIPADPLSMDYNTQDYQRAYLNTLSALGLDVGNNGLTLTPELWESAYNLYAFKLVPGPIKSSIESKLVRGSVNLSFKFKQATPAPIEVLVYSETNRTLEITATNKAFIV